MVEQRGADCERIQNGRKELPGTRTRATGNVITDSSALGMKGLHDAEGKTVTCGKPHIVLGKPE